MSERVPRFSVAGKLAALGAAPLLLAVIAAVVLNELTAQPLLAIVATSALAVPLWLWRVSRAVAPVLSLFRALAGTTTSYRDGDFSTSISWDGDDELAELVSAHNELGATLREQRLSLVQRELLLDTMVQHTPVAMILVGPSDRVVYGNLAARRLLGAGRRLEGHELGELLAEAPEPMRAAIAGGGDGLFMVGDDEDEEIHHLARRDFRLNGKQHELFLVRRLTTELRRQEVHTWKKVIRVISHELNNSLAPVASLAHSGGELVRREQYQRLEELFATIEERARHLDTFIRGYARFAKLPAPRKEEVSWSAFFDRLRAEVAFSCEPPAAELTSSFDAAQLEQAVLNLLKNAHESGSAPDEVELRLCRVPGWVRLDVLDRGTGMPEATLASALVPFYSTKRTGTGLGLALAREIAEAHGGRIGLSNRDGGGVCVSLSLPES